MLTKSKKLKVKSKKSTLRLRSGLMVNKFKLSKVNPSNTLRVDGVLRQAQDTFKDAEQSRSKQSRTIKNKKSGDINFKFDEKGLIPAVIQDYKTGEVLMVAYMNNLSIKKTLTTGKTNFWSRSRNKLWLKGETSGHFQIVKSVFYDCDIDCLLFRVRQIGVACHTGNRSCFYRKLNIKN